MPNETISLRQYSSAEITNSKLRELILLAGKDSTGKSSSLVSQAKLVEELQPEAKVWVIDTENKFASAMKSFGPDAPSNVVLYKGPTMNHATAALAEIIEKHSPWDWLFIESAARVWERAQDLAYTTIAGVTKVEYLERKAKGKGPIPSPDDFWKIAKGAHDGAFFDLVAQQDDLNTIITTTIARPPKADAFMKENADRKATRIELGIDVGLDGAPRIPYLVETLMLLDLKNGVVTCRVLRDNLSTQELTRVEFEIPTKKDFGLQFFSYCRS